MDATAMVPRDVLFPGIDLSVLNGNLLDNVLEACMQMEGEETGGHAEYTVSASPALTGSCRNTAAFSTGRIRRACLRRR